MAGGLESSQPFVAIKTMAECRKKELSMVPRNLSSWDTKYLSFLQ